MTAIAVDHFVDRELAPAWGRLTTDQQRMFKHLLVEMRDVTVPEFVVMVEALPAPIRARLAEGPHPRRWTCGVCNAFGRERWPNGAAPLEDEPQWRVWAWHEVPKLFMLNPDSQFYGRYANENYRRCVVTYQAAGWPADPEEPNA
jgi:hypothetical protein